MSAIEPLFNLSKIPLRKISKDKLQLFEITCFLTVYQNLMKFFMDHYPYMETSMIDANLIKLILNDMISTGDYSLEGIAYYTQVPDDVIYEIMIGNNNNPSLHLARKIIDLHKSIRSSLYEKIIDDLVGSCLNNQVDEVKLPKP